MKLALNMSKLMRIGSRRAKAITTDPLEQRILTERLRGLSKVSADKKFHPVDGQARASRKKTHRIGEIVLAPERNISCIIHNFSDAGMRIELTEERQPPTNFRLRVPTLEFDRRVQVVWQSDNIVGLIFE